MKFKDTKYGDLTNEIYDGFIVLIKKKLTSLEGSPKIVEKNYYCDSNKLTSLEIGKKKSKSMKKNILHISFGIFKDILKYKCANNEIYLSEIEPHYTSKSCSCCNTINNDLNITQRMFKCNECGTEIDRDYNSVLNIIDKY